MLPKEAGIHNAMHHACLKEHERYQESKAYGLSVEVSTYKDQSLYGYHIFWSQVLEGQYVCLNICLPFQLVLYFSYGK